ncbi:metal-dependent transcriptional regulator [bacterium]|nr:metal-dependent transcriptional regulator [bacterium]
MILSASLEDYLEAIFELYKSKRAVRVRDVAKKLGVTMPSVNGALKNLEARGLIEHEKYEYIELTESGNFHAAKVASRHSLIFTFLRDVLGVDKQTAQTDACKIEHVLSSGTVEKMNEYIDRSLSNAKEQ